MTLWAPGRKLRRPRGTAKYLNLLATMRRHKTSRARRVTGVFLFVWLGLALQPCAMAFGTDGDHDCPHCPPPIETAHHAGHSMATSDMCASGDDCSPLDDFNYDGRTPETKVKDVQLDPVAVIAIGEFEPAVIDHGLNARTAGFHLSGAPPPRYKLLCVYRT